MWFHPKLLLPTLRCSKFLSFFLSAIYIEPFFKEPPPPLQVLPSFPLPSWEITKSHWCLHFMEEMWDSETLMVWLRAETRNQNSYWGNQGSMFCCVIRSQRCIPPRGMCLTCLRGQKLGAKNNNKWSQRRGIIFQKSCLIFREQNLVLFKGSSQTGHFKWRYKFTFSHTGDSSSFYLISVLAKKCLFLPKSLQQCLTSGLSWTTQLLVRRKKQAFPGSMFFYIGKAGKEWDLHVKISGLSSFKVNGIQSLITLMLVGRGRSWTEKWLGFLTQILSCSSKAILWSTTQSELKIRPEPTVLCWNSCDRNPGLLLSSQFIIKAASNSAFQPCHLEYCLPNLLISRKSYKYLQFEVTLE